MIERISTWIDTERFVAENLGETGYTEEAGVWRVPCPIHGGARASLKICDTGLWYCHACKKSGNTLQSFIIAWKHLENTYTSEVYNDREVLCGDNSAELEAIDFLYPYTVYGEETLDAQEIEERRIHIAQRAQQQSDAYERERVATERYVSGEWIPPGLQKTWRYGPINKAQAYLYGRGYVSSVLEQQRVYTWEEKGNHYPLLFVLWYQHTILGYMERAISPNIEPKYMTVAGLQKQKWLYGDVPDGKHVIVLTEGLTDRIKIIQYGYPHVFATLGSVLSAEQADLLEQHASHVICAYHDDEAGNRGAWGVETQMAFRQVRTSRLILPVKDACIAGAQAFWYAFDLACSELAIQTKEVTMVS